MSDHNWKRLSNILSDLLFLTVIYVGYILFSLFVTSVLKMDEAVAGDIYICTLIFVCLKIVIKRIDSLRHKEEMSL